MQNQAIHPTGAAQHCLHRLAASLPGFVRFLMSPIQESLTGGAGAQTWLLLHVMQVFQHRTVALTTHQPLHPGGNVGMRPLKMVTSTANIILLILGLSEHMTDMSPNTLMTRLDVNSLQGYFTISDRGRFITPLRKSE